jgi:hypothetical protein
MSKCSCLAVVVSLRDLRQDQDHKAPAGDFREPLSLAEWTNTVRSPIPTPEHFLGPMGHFLAAVESSIRAASPLNSSTPSGCWLSALIEMQITSSAEAWDFRPAWGEDSLKELSQICSSLESDRRVIMRIQERIADTRRSDYALAFSRLEQLLAEARSDKTQLEEELNNQYRTSSVQEARNAVSCGFPNPRISEVAQRMLTRSSYSHCPGFHLHSDQSGFLDIRHERAANQRDGKKYTFFRLHVDRAVDFVRTEFLSTAFHEAYRQDGICICQVQIRGSGDVMARTDTLEMEDQRQQALTRLLAVSQCSFPAFHTHASIP